MAEYAREGMGLGIRVSVWEFPQIGGRILSRQCVQEDLVSVLLLKHWVLDT